MKNMPLNNFLAIFKLPREELKVAENTSIDNLQKQAQEFLKADLLNVYVKMLNKGYQPTIEQEEQFFNKIVTKITNNEYKEVPHFLLNLVKDGLNMKPNLFTFLVLNTKVFESIENYKKYNKSISTDEKNQKEEYVKSDEKHFVEKILPLFDKKDYTDDLINNWQAHLFNMPTHSAKIFDESKGKHDSGLSNKLFNQTLKLYRINDLVFKNTKEEDYLLLIKNLENLSNNFDFSKNKKKYLDLSNKKIEFNEVYIDKYQQAWNNGLFYTIKKMKSDFDNIYKNNIDNLLMKTENIFIDNYLDKVTKDKIFKNINSFSVSDLPENIKKLVFKIEEKNIILLNDKNLMNENQLHNFNDLVVNKLPSILNRYLSMPEEYRQSLINTQGKNAQDLLIESIQNIYEHLSHLEININEDKLKSLSINAKYIKAKI